MKRLSDYKGDEAIELWADLLEPLTEILTDKEIANTFRSGKSKILIAKTILKDHKKDAEKILLRIDPTPIDGLNIVLRLVALLGELGESEELKSFFGFAEQVKMANESFGSVTANIEAEEK